MSALKRIIHMQQAHERLAAKYANHEAPSNRARYLAHVECAESYKVAARYVQEARSVVLSWSLLGTVVAALVIGYFVER